ncbi:MAG: exo-alpha-sialidase [Elusimicrobia bacterium]|nr:exo-alpha-sialidase [Elusimicrobiota bacterium]
MKRILIAAAMIGMTGGAYAANNSASAQLGLTVANGAVAAVSTPARAAGADAPAAVPARADGTNPNAARSFVTPVGEFTSNHGSALAELPGGKLIACWYAGSREMARDVQIYCSNSDLSGASWDKPRVVVAAQERAEASIFSNKSLGNPALYLDGENILWLFYSSVGVGGWAGARVDYKTSADLGKTWSDSKRLDGPLGRLTRTKPVSLGGNRIMVPLYYEFLDKQSYTCILTLEKGKIAGKTCYSIPGTGHLQPALVVRGNSIFAYMREVTGKGILFSEFDLDRKTWSAPVPIGLPNPDSSVEALDTGDGSIILAYNPTSRSTLRMAVSEDGKKFREVRDFAADTATPGAEFSYPAMIRTSDGAYHITYTNYRTSIAHIRFNRQWVSGE